MRKNEKDLFFSSFSQTRPGVNWSFLMVIGMAGVTLKPDVNKRLVLAILKETTSGPTTIKDLTTSTHLAPQLVEKDLCVLIEASFLSILDDCIHLSSSQRIRLGIEALSLGSSLKEVCRRLSWGEFEDFCLEVLYANGFAVNKHFRFKATGRGWEIDLAARKGSILMLIDCKHWNRGHQASSLRKVAERNLACTKALLTVMPEVLDRLKITNLSSLSLLPVILTMLRSPVQIHLGVPIVSISQFNDFIYELPEHIGGLAVFSIKDL